MRLCLLCGFTPPFRLSKKPVSWSKGVFKAQIPGASLFKQKGNPVSERKNQHWSKKKPLIQSPTDPKKKNQTDPKTFTKTKVQKNQPKDQEKQAVSAFK